MWTRGEPRAKWSFKFGSFFLDTKPAYALFGLGLSLCFSSLDAGKALGSMQS